MTKIQNSKLYDLEEMTFQFSTFGEIKLMLDC